MSELDRVQLWVAWSLRYTDKDFRTPKSIAKQLGLPESDVRWALHAWQLRGKVRQPIVTGKQFDDWWRWTERGETWREKLQRGFAYLGSDYTRLREDLW